VNTLFLYSVISLTLILLFILVRLFLNLYFKTKEKRYKSKTYPIILGITILGSSYALLFKLDDTLIYFLNTVFKTSIIKENSTSTLDIVFFVCLTLVILFYIYYLFRASEKAYYQINYSLNSESQIQIPKDDYVLSVNLTDRVQKLVELRYEKDGLRLKYDETYNFLFGKFQQGLHNHLHIYYCSDEINFLEITVSEITTKYNEIINLIKLHDLHEDSDILSIYYICEQGKLNGEPHANMFFASENELINHLVPFSNYLKKIIREYQVRKLPFSISEDESSQKTLSETFIHPHFTLEDDSLNIQSNLEEYVTNWLDSESKKHLVLLGDYGMGKSSFLKYYEHRISSQICDGDFKFRYPVFIPLTNSSPRHGGINNLISTFISKNLSISSDLFFELVHRGRILFILDGFDEMGFVGSHAQRIKQLDAIWKLVFNRNKILISGRPSYFPSKDQLLYAFNDKKALGLVGIPTNEPYFQRIYLTPLGSLEIQKSLEIYYGKDLSLKYINFITYNQSLLELCKRPSMMHIVREMIPDLIQELGKENLRPSDLIQKYINHWIDRQLGKSIVSAFESKKDKVNFVLDFFKELAAEYFIQGIEKMSPTEIIQNLNIRIAKLKLATNDDIEGFHSEILTGCLIEIEDNGYKFVHKSFKEYLISQFILDKLKLQELNKPILRTVAWTAEIDDFVSELVDRETVEQDKHIPKILSLAYGKKRIFKLKILIFHFNCHYNYKFDQFFHFIFRILNKLYPKKEESEKKDEIRFNDFLFSFLKRIFFPKLTSKDVNDLMQRRSNMDLIAKAYVVSFRNNELSTESYPEITYYLELKYNVSLEQLLAK